MPLDGIESLFSAASMPRPTNRAQATLDAILAVAAIFSRIWTHTFGVPPVWDLIVAAVPARSHQLIDGQREDSASLAPATRRDSAVIAW